MHGTIALPDADRSASLLRDCAVGDRRAFRELYDMWAARLHGIALRITHQSSLAADATHDAFVQVWQQAGRFDAARGSAEAWLVSLVRYRALDIVRRRGREVGGYEPPEQADDSPDALTRMVGNAEGAALRHCLDNLDPEHRRVIVLAYIEGLSHSTLAERLHMPLGTVKSWIRRGLASLRGCLEP